MEYEVDTYTLEYVENEDKYYISFKDSVGNNCRIEIEKEIFDVYMTSRKAYTKIKNETSRYIEHSELTDISLYNRSLNKKSELDNIVTENINEEMIIKKIWELPEPQNRRVYMYIVKKLTMTEIAKIEGCAISSISRGINLGIDNLKKNLKNF